jgi:hypothetical protein
MPKGSLKLPDLPLKEWEQTKHTLHLFFQIVGKVKLALQPRKNHWWGITLHIGPTGFTTRPVPFNNGLDRFEISFNFLEHRLELVSSSEKSGSFPLEDGLSVPVFQENLFGLLADAGIAAQIRGEPYDIPGITKPFSRLETYNTYQREYVRRFWKIMTWVDGVFEEFSGRFYGKTSPVHLYWHHMDLAVTRFSGKKGPKPDPSARISDKDAYSHEVISFGFWAGDDQVPAPAFYSYTYPLPNGLDREPLEPEQAKWVESNGSPMAVLFYDDIRSVENPRKALFDFLETAYRAGAKHAKWDIQELTVPPLEAM